MAFSAKARKKTLQTRLLGVSCLLIVLPLLVTSILLYRASCDAVFQAEQAALRSSLEEGSRLLHNELSAAYNTVSTVSEHLEIQNIQARGCPGIIRWRNSFPISSMLKIFSRCWGSIPRFIGSV